MITIALHLPCLAVDRPADHLHTDHKPGEPITAGRRLADAGVIVLLLSSTDPQTSEGEREYLWEWGMRGEG